MKGTRIAEGRPQSKGLRWAAVGELSGRIAHDSNNLLAGILGQAELGLLANDPIRMKSSLEAIVRSSRELKAITERMVSFARLIENGEQNCNLLEIFRTLYGMLERSFTKNGIRVERVYGNVPMTWCDPGGAAPPLFFAIRSALEGLSAARGGSVLLEAALDGGNIVFRVEARAHADTSLTTPSERPGDLTLAQASDFARLEGGSLSESRTASESVLEVRFPIRKGPSAYERIRSVTIAESASAVPEATTLTALVVEDEAPIRELIQEVLEGVDCLVCTEADAAAGLRTFSRRRFDIVFTDLSMPGMDGVTLVGKLRAHVPEAVVVVITGRATEESVKGALRAGAMTVLRKPFELSDLRTIIRAIRTDPTGGTLREIALECKNLMVN